MSPILPEQDDPETKATTVYLPEKMIVRLTEIAEETRREAKGKGQKGFNRNEIVINFLNWAIGEYEKEQRGKKR